MRAFIAIELPRELIRELEAEISKLRAGANTVTLRWSDPATIHLTLRFLGEIDDGQVELVRSTLDRALADQPAFTFQIDTRLGCFPSWKRPRVFWIGVGHNESAVRRLNRTIERELVARGFDAEQRRFHPHLTIARVKRGVNRTELQSLATALQEIELEAFGQVEVNKVTLMRSELKPDGAVHTPVYQAALTGGAG